MTLVVPVFFLSAKARACAGDPLCSRTSAIAVRMCTSIERSYTRASKYLMSCADWWSHGTPRGWFESEPIFPNVSSSIGTVSSCAAVMVCHLYNSSLSAMLS